MCCSTIPRWRCRCHTLTSARPSPRIRSPPRRRPGGSGTSACRRAAASGYVFSSAHTSVEAAERELRPTCERDHRRPARCLAAQAHLQTRISARVLAPQLRRHRAFGRLHRAARGLGAGAGGVVGRHAQRRNAGHARTPWTSWRGASTTFFTYRWERVIDFLKLHYLLSRREDPRVLARQPPRGVHPDRLRELLVLWRHQPPSRYDLHRVEEVFPSASYQYVLYGMGFRPEAEGFSRRSDDADRADGYFREAAQLTRKMLGALPSNRDLIDHIRTPRTAPAYDHDTPCSTMSNTATCASSHAAAPMSATT